MSKRAIKKRYQLVGGPWSGHHIWLSEKSRTLSFKVEVEGTSGNKLYCGNYVYQSSDKLHWNSAI